MNLSDFSRDQLVHNLGLDRQVRTMDTLLPALGIFSAGLLAGVGLGLLLAPKSGRELRHDISSGIHDLGERSQTLVHDATDRARQRIDKLRGGGKDGDNGQDEGEGENPYGA